MRSLPARPFSVGLALVVAIVPALITVTTSPEARAASRSALGPVYRSPARPIPLAQSAPSLPSLPSLPSAPSAPSAQSVQLASSTQSVQPAAHPVATTISELPLTAVATKASAKAGSGGVVAVSRRVDRTAAFQTVGVTWASLSVEPDLLISVRTHGVKGWSGWTALDDDAGDDATATGPGVRGGTDPLWFGASDGVQTRIVVRSGKLPKDLRLELVNPGSSSYDRVAASTVPGSTASTARISGTASTIGTASTASTTGGVAEPLILSRAAWGADESKVRSAPTYMPTIKAAVLHHTAGPNNYSPRQVPSILRGDYAYHLSRGWNDIGYNALVDRFGRIWEGRAGGLDRSVMGAHAGGFNTDTFGVSMIGNYDLVRPSAASIAAVTRVMAWKLDLNHRDPAGTTRLTSSGGGTSRYASGTTVTFPVIMGHRNTGNTACPGRYLYPYLPSIRKRVAVLMKAALTNPTGPPASVPRGTPVVITARSLAAQTWRLDVTASCGYGRVARISGSARAGREITATWNGRLADGLPARPGRYQLTLTSSSANGTARPIVDTVLVVPPAPVTVASGTPSSGPGGYQPVTPTRLLNTEAAGQIGLGPGGRVDVPVLGVAGIPTSGVTSVVLNLTAICVSDETSLAVWPAGGPQSNRPVASVPAGGTSSILVTARVGADGAISIGNARGVTELTADVVGYYQAGAGGLPILPIASTRLYDSRADPAGPLSGGQARLVPLPSFVAGVPSAQIKAVVVDVSALSPRSSGTLTAYSLSDVGDLPTLSYGKGGSVDNLAIVEVTGGAMLLRATGTPVDAVVDVLGLVVDAGAGTSTGASLFTAIKPTLIFDSGRTSGGVLTSGSPRKVVVTGPGTGVPPGAKAVLIELTAVAPSATTSLQAYPWGQSAPLDAAVRVSAGATHGNLVLVPVGTGGAITVSNAQGHSQVRVDVHGYLG